MLKIRSRELFFYGLTHRQAGLIGAIGATQGNINAYRIAKWVILEPHTISANLNRMEADGYIEKVNLIENGRRTSKLKLTEKGWKAYNEVKRFESIPKVLEVLTSGERKTLNSILKKLRDEALKQMGIRTKLPYPPF
jgi:DNA-binding MarR family transcriptional regulator